MVFGVCLFLFSYDMFDDFIKDGNGWKILCYIFYSLKMFGFVLGYGFYGLGLGGNF